MSEHKFPANPSRSNGPLPIPVAAVRLVRPETVTDGAVAARAYQRFVARGGAHGRDEQDWSEAKAELLAEVHKPLR